MEKSDFPSIWTRFPKRHVVLNFKFFAQEGLQIFWTNISDTPSNILYSLKNSSTFKFFFKYLLFSLFKKSLDFKLTQKLFNILFIPKKNHLIIQCFIQKNTQFI